MYLQRIVPGTAPARVRAAARLRAAFAAALLLPLAGCLGAGDEVSPSSTGHAMTWAPGNWWHYDATFHGNVTVPVAIVVHESRADGFTLGTNVTGGFFGLPFHGNVTRDLNPVVMGQAWPLYDFPLRDGKTWSYTMFGHAATAKATAAVVDVPGAGPSPGYRIEATAYGRPFASYDYAPVAGWFTRLTLADPAKHEVLLDVALVAHGVGYDDGYFVQRLVHDARIPYPAVPGALDVQVPEGAGRLDATLSVATDGGLLRARVLDAQGRVLAQAEAAAVGADAASADRARGGAWRIEHEGLGEGLVLLEVFAVERIGDAPARPAGAASHRAGLLDALQSARPFVPHTGHVTSTGPPVAE